MTWDYLMSTATFGLSARAISGDGNHHPHDPSDLVRCIAYCERTGITDLSFMASRSVFWARMVPEWDRLVAMLRQEVETSTNGRAPETYREMRRVIYDGVDCDTCDKTGRIEGCDKCKGTGRRCGGRCRACRGSGVARRCPSCHGNGYVDREDAA